MALSTSTTSLADYLVYVPGHDGRKVYIDPSLIPTFTECVDPTNDAGRKVANDIQQKLSSDATGTQAGQATGDAAEFYMDIGSIGERCVRVFYRILQAETAEISKGPGVYIHNVQSISSNSRNVDVGLFHMAPTGVSWAHTRVASGELNTKVLRLGSMVDAQGLMELDDLTKVMLKASNSETDKSSFNLYHCPLAFENNGQEYNAPELRVGTVSPNDLADVLIRTASLGEWSGRQYDNYKVYCYNDASKLLLNAFEIIRNKPVRLSKFHFVIIAPYSPFSFIERAAAACGATVELSKTFSTGYSILHQRFDPSSLKLDAINACSNYSSLIEKNPNISFIQLWQGLGSNAQLPSS